MLVKYSLIFPAREQFTIYQLGYRAIDILFLIILVLQLIESF